MIRSLRAFTLIELLVVIAIIAILAAVLFPVFAQAKESAMTTKCICQMKQVSTAMILYADDSDGKWVPVANEGFLSWDYAPQTMWIGYDNFGSCYEFCGNMLRPAENPVKPGMIDPYLKSYEVRVCPKKKAEWQLALGYNYFNERGSSAYYSRNPAARGNEYGPGAKNCQRSQNFGVIECEGVSIGEVDEPAGTLAVWEHAAYVPVCNFLQRPDWFDAPPQYDRGYRDHFNFLHRDGAVTIWMDGHVKRTTFPELRRPMFSVRKDIYQSP